MEAETNTSVLSTPTKEQTGHSDSLLQCLIFLTQFYSQPFSAEALTDGLPLHNNKLTPSLFVRAAERAELSARLVKRPLDKFSKLLLPIVLILKSNQACILTKINKNTVEVVFPDAGSSAETIDMQTLKEEYAGYAFLAKPSYRFDQRADEYHIEKPTSWFWGTIWRYRKTFYQVMISAVLINLFALASPLFVMNVYDRVVPNNATETLWVLASGVTIVFIFDLFMRLLRAYLIDVSGKKVDTILASMIMEHILNMRLEAKPASAGSFANNLHGYEALRDFFTSATIVGLIDLPFLFLFLALIAFIGGAVAYVSLIAVPLVMISGFFLEIPARKAIEKSYFGSAQKHALLIETVSSLETIKTVGAAGQIQRKWERYVAIVGKASLRSKFFNSVALNFTTFVIQMVTVVSVLLGVYLIVDGKLTTGGLVACTLLSGRALAPLSQIAGIITRFQQSRIGLVGLNRIMELPEERPPNSHFLHRPTLEGCIEFKDVSFAYPRQKIRALENISLRINPLERVAILGRNGSGKSTLLRLMTGLYQPNAGYIRHDNIDIGQIDPADLRKNIGYLAQDNTLFYGTVRENITIALPWADDLSILRAAELAGVDAFVKRHPDGYDMIVGERGEGLSGGQRQAIILARTLLANPPILLMDEPTSSLDNSSEQELIRSLTNLVNEKTLIIVTHKPQLLALANRLIIIDNGKIVSDGPKDQVLAALAQNKVRTADT